MQDLELYRQGYEKGVENVRRTLLSRFSFLKNSSIMLNPQNKQEDAILAQAQIDDECRIIIDLIRYLEVIEKSPKSLQQSQTFNQREISAPERYSVPVAKQTYKIPEDKTYAEFINYISRKEFSIIRNGYNKQEVDDFLDRICDTLDYFDGKTISGLIVPLNEINEKTFDYESMGYDCKEVDSLLEEIVNRYPGAN